MHPRSGSGLWMAPGIWRRTMTRIGRPIFDTALILASAQVCWSHLEACQQDESIQSRAVLVQVADGNGGHQPQQHHGALISRMVHRHA